MSNKQELDVLVSVSNLHKSYADVEVLTGVDLAFKAGEIHAFLGANGAGKSTFLGCLSGAVIPTKGHILFNGKDHTSFSPREALDMGIGIIYQHLQVFDDLTVAENIFLGHELRKFGMVDRTAQVAESKKLLARLEVPIDPRALIKQLSTGEKKIVEIARALNSKPKLLILDEPTAAMGDKEMDALHRVVRHVAHNEGLGVVYVTHLLDEIDDIADVVTVLRNGQIVWTKPKSETNAAILAEAIAPSSSLRNLSGHTVKLDKPAVLELKEYRSPFTGPITLSLHEGEAVAVYGLLGSGRSDLLESLFGALPQMGGEYRIGGESVNFGSPSEALANGVSLVASDRAEQSMFGELSANDNLLMPHFGRKLLPTWLRRSKNENKHFDRIAKQLSIHPPNSKLAASHFSGGNAQKIMLGRWLLDKETKQQIILLDEPTQGVDIGARAQLYEALQKIMENGGSVIFASSDPHEVVTLADRVLVLGYGSQIALIDNPKDEGVLVEMAHKTSRQMASA